MTADQLESGALRFPMTKKSPPAHSAWLFPRRAFGIVIVKNHAGRFRNGERGDRFVSGGPGDIPPGTLDETALMITIPSLGADEDENEPGEHSPLRGKSPRRTRRHRCGLWFAFPKPRQTEHSR